MEQQHDLELKQKYLRQQIIEQGYSPQHFLEYLMRQKPSGQDISSWSYDQLNRAVQKYKQIQVNTDPNHKVQQQHDDAKNNPQSKISVISSEVEQQREKIEYQKTGLFDFRIEKTIECQEFKGFLQDTSKMKFDVIQSEITTKGGLFFGIGKITELWYTIKCNLLDSTIKRSEQDFSWLRSTLVRLYPDWVIPPFIKVQDIDKETQTSLQQRRHLINLFLKTLYQNQLIFNTKLVISFLTWTDYNKFIQAKKTYNSIPFKRSLKNILNLEGKVNIQISSQNATIIKASQFLTTHLQSIYEKLNSQLNFVYKQFQNLSSSLKCFGNIFIEYQDVYTKFCDAVPRCRDNKIINTISTISSTIQDWGNIFTHHQNCITQNLQSILKYNKIEIQSIKQIIERRNSWKSQYLKYKDTLNKKKQKIISDPTKWQLTQPQKYQKMEKPELIKHILPKQSNLQEKMKVWFAYLNKQTETEVQRILKINANRLAIYWTNYGVQTLKSIQDQNQIFKEISNGILLHQRKYSFTYQ